MATSLDIRTEPLIVDPLADYDDQHAPPAARSAAALSLARLGWRARTLLLGLAHVLLFGLSLWGAFCLRFDFAVPLIMERLFWLTLPWVVLVKVVLFYWLGHFHGWWRYVTFADLSALLRDTTLSLLVIATLDYFILPSMPRSVLILDCLLTIGFVAAARSSRRLLDQMFWLGNRHCPGALIVGADLQDGILAHQIQSHLQYRIRGFLDDETARKKTRLGTIPILGGLEQVGELAARYQIAAVLVTAGSISGGRLRRLMELCEAAQLELKIIPQVADLFSGNSRLPIRDVQINDLLRRDPVRLDDASIAELIQNRTVLVTGAGGSIGSEICRQALRFRPRGLVMLEQAENSLFAIDCELRELDSGAELHACVGDITDRARVRQLLERHQPAVIFHAAAHKHVPMMEFNVGEAIKNNVFGTKTLADAACEFGVDRFVLISTDKAVKPSSVMGASKQLAERYIQALAQLATVKFVAVRFGNVLGSAGSVVPIFLEQIRRGGPITITDPAMTRFFMTIPEASQLVLQAAAMGQGGEIFVLEMGEPVRIVDLARDLVRLSGLPARAIDVAFTGLRPGEKLNEELYCDQEQTAVTSHAKVRAVYHRPSGLPQLNLELADLLAVLDESDETIRRKLRELVPEYSPAVAGVAGPAEATGWTGATSASSSA